MSTAKLMNWVFGVGFWVIFIVLQLALSQRDEARQFRAQFDGEQMVCRMVKS